MIKKDYLEGTNPKVIFEFGSYDGKDALELKEMFPSARVIAFEADPIRFEICKNNLDGTDIEMYHAAITDFNGEVPFYQTIWNITDDDDLKKTEGIPGVAGSILKHTVGHIKGQKPWQRMMDDAPIMVPAITIESFCDDYNVKHIDYMHMDVEGAVKEVLGGFGNIRPVLIFAEVLAREKGFENSNSFQEYKIMFKEIGYNFVKSYPDCNALFKHGK